MKRKRLSGLVFLLAAFIAVQAQKTFLPGNKDSKIHFVIKNFGIKTGGDFSGLKGTIKFDAKNPAIALFDVTINTATINTGNSTRDGHLKKEEYFDVAKYPVIHIVSTKVETASKPGQYKFSGNLTIKDVTKPVSFQFTAIQKNGGYLFTSDELTINRRDYKVGGSSVSMADELKVTITVFAR